MPRWLKWKSYLALLAIAPLGGCREPAKAPTESPSSDSAITTFSFPTPVPAPDSLRIFRKHPPKHILLKPNDVVSTGDIIQAVYRTGEKHMAILSVDGNRNVTVHFPEKRPCQTRVPVIGRFVPLGNAFELDNAPLYEHFFLVTSPEPINVEALTRWFRKIPYEKLKSTPLPGHARITADLRLKKR